MTRDVIFLKLVLLVHLLKGKPMDTKNNEVVRDEVRHIQERNERRRQQNRNVYQYDTTHIMSNDLIHFIRVISDNQNIPLNRIDVVEMMLDMFPN